MSKLNTVQPYNIRNWPYTHDSMKPGSHNFYGPDREDLFERNLKYMPNDWMYKDTPVVYNFNSHGLRMTKELDTLSSNLVYVSGTSYAMGIGIPEEKRFSDIIADRLKFDYINYAGPTFSIKLQVYSFFNYIKKFTTPKICIFEYPPIHGYTFFDNDKSLTFSGKHIPLEYPTYINAYDLLKNTDFLLKEAQCYSTMLREFCKSLGCKLIELSYYPDDKFVQDFSLKSIDMDSLNIYNVSERYARDVMKQNNNISAHPGTGVHLHTANEILKDL